MEADESSLLSISDPNFDVNIAYEKDTTEISQVCVNTILGITVIKPLDTPKHPPVILFYYPDSDFISPHYQSVCPRSEVNVLRTFLAESEGRQGSSIQDTFSSSLDVSEGGVGLQLTVENFDSIPVVLAEENDR